MSFSYAPGPSVFHPATMSKPLFTRHKTDPDVTAFPSRGASPAGSFYGDGLRAHDLPLRGASPSGSFYSHYSSSSPSVASASSSSASTHDLPFTLPHPLTTPWLTRSPRSTTAHIVVSPSPSTSEFASSPPESPMDDIPETELRRRQLDKATRILGESIPIDLVFTPRRPLAKPFPDPPPRRSADSPQPGAHERFLTERPARGGGGGKLARRASLSLATFASKLRGGGSGTSTPHSRDSSQDSSSHASASPSTSSEHGHHAHPPSPRLHGPASTSPITFSFPRVRAPSRGARMHTPPPPAAGLGLGLVLDISSAHGHEHEYDAYDDDEATPVRSHPLHSYSHSDVLPRVRVVPAHAHAESEHLPLRSRPGTPFDLRPDTPFLDRPGTPFTSFLPSSSNSSSSSFNPLSSSSNPSFDSSRANNGDLNNNGDFNNKADLQEEEEGDAFLSPSRRERGQGWSGEWNQRDMQDVIAKLRTLK
ncbi:hypothetical protein B0H11DRAFT_1960001 [Mycena galericulata]|nr:hypothetical protein B0H11DRAFT_1960001 [Mycena galericulata]